MKFFNLDLHISVIADIKKIFNDLGHQVDVNYLSNHSWVFNQQPCNRYTVNQTNWKNVNLSMCEEFYEKHKTELEKYDGFIVTHIPMLSLLYEKFNKPIIFVASTRYEYPFTQDKERWKWFNNYINENENIITIANNLYDKWYCEQFLNRNFDYIPSLCEYTNAKYNPKNNKSILFSKQNINIPNTINKNLLHNYTWKDLFSYKSMIHIPYNASTMSIFEQYSANVPLFFPSKNLIMKLIDNKIAYSEVSYNQILFSESKSVVEYKNEIDPNNINEKKLFLKIIELSDFYNFPFISYFETIEELMDKLNEDLNEISHKMSKFNEFKKKRTYEDWSKILDKIE